MVGESSYTCDTHGDGHFLDISDADSAEGNFLCALEGDGLNGATDEDDLAGDEDEIYEEDGAKEEFLLTVRADLRRIPSARVTPLKMSVLHDLPVKAMTFFCAYKS